MYFSKPNFMSFSRSIQVDASMDRPFHCTSYSYLDFFWRREMIFSTRVLSRRFTKLLRMSARMYISMFSESSEEAIYRWWTHTMEEL